MRVHRDKLERKSLTTTKIKSWVFTLVFTRISWKFAHVHKNDHGGNRWQSEAIETSTKNWLSHVCSVFFKSRIIRQDDTQNFVANCRWLIPRRSITDLYSSSCHFLSRVAKWATFVALNNDRNLWTDPIASKASRMEMSEFFSTIRHCFVVWTSWFCDLMRHAD